MAQFSKVDAIPGFEETDPDYYAVQEAVKTADFNGYRKTANTKRVSELSFSGTKIHPQKGLGRARQGERGNPHMYHGAKMFGPKPRNPQRKINKQRSRQARVSALIHHAQDETLWINTDDELAGVSKTRVLDGLFQEGDFAGKLLIFCNRDDTVHRAARNHPDITCLPVDRLNTKDLANHDVVIFTASAWDELDFLIAGEAEVEEAIVEKSEDFATEPDKKTAADIEAESDEASAASEAEAEDAGEEAAEEETEAESGDDAIEGADEEIEDESEADEESAEKEGDE